MPRRLIGGPNRLPTHFCKDGNRVAGSTTHFDPIEGQYVRKCRVCKKKFHAEVVSVDETVQAGLGIQLFKVRRWSDANEETAQ